MTVVLKLGGSVITEKDRPETLDGDALDRAAGAVADALSSEAIDRLVLVHGGGSFGHHQASEQGVSTTEGTHDAVAAVAIHAAMKTLNQFVISRLHARDVPALPVHPLSAASRDADERLSFPMDQVTRMLDEGFLPVLHGDGVVHEGAGVTVLSGDEIVACAATDLGADRVGLCSTVPGVLDADDEVIPAIDSFEGVAEVLGGSAATSDVTGGMAGKVRELLRLDAPSHVFDLDGLDDFLAGGSPGTRIG